MTRQDSYPGDAGQSFRGPAYLLYFTSPDCQVCKVLKPKVRELLATKFPEMRIHFIDVSRDRATAGRYHVFTVPVLIVFFEDREFFRWSRNISIRELENEILRPYQLLFGT